MNDANAEILPGAAYFNVSATVENSEIERLSGYVREATAFRIIQALPPIAKGGEIFGYGLVLVWWSTKQIREATTGEGRSYLWLNLLSSTDRGHKWA